MCYQRSISLDVSTGSRIGEWKSSHHGVHWMVVISRGMSEAGLAELPTHESHQLKPYGRWLLRQTTTSSSRSICHHPVTLFLQGVPADALPKEIHPITDTQEGKASFLLPLYVQWRQLSGKQYSIPGSLLWQGLPIRNISLTTN